MARKGNRIIIKLANKETGEAYYTTKNRINVTDKLEMMKFSRKEGKHMLFKEAKVSK